MMADKRREQFIDWVLSTPEHLGGEEARMYLVCKLGFPIGFLFHFVAFFLFLNLGFKELVYFNIFSIVAWPVGSWILVRYGEIRFPFVVLVLIEMPAHAFLATLATGTEAGFYIWVLIPTIFVFLAPFLAWPIRIAVCVLNVVLLAFLAMLAVKINAWYDLTAGWKMFFTAFSLSGTAASLAVVFSVNQWAAVDAEKRLAVEFNRAEGLLRNILPDVIAERLKESPDQIADEHMEVSVLFADIVNFTSIAATLSASEVVANLNRVFSRFDDLIEQHGVEKIKTIGDAYMAVAGLPNGRDDHAQVMVSLGLDMQKAVEEINADSAIPLQIRIGINSGPVVAGVIGHKKFAYDLWGDTVNVAARIEEAGEPGRVMVTQDTRGCLSGTFDLEDIGKLPIKGKGNVQAFLVNS